MTITFLSGLVLGSDFWVPNLRNKKMASTPPPTLGITGSRKHGERSLAEKLEQKSESWSLT